MKKTTQFALAILVLPLVIPFVEASTQFLGGPTNVTQLNNATTATDQGPSNAGTLRVVPAAGSTIAVTIATGTVVNIISTNTLSVQGTFADNSVDSSSKVATLPARANSANPSWSEGNQVPLSVDLNGNLRTSGTLMLSTTTPVNVYSTTTFTVQAPQGQAIPVISTSPIVDQPYSVATPTSSSQTVSMGNSVVVFTADANRRTYAVTSLPTNVGGYLYCRWGAGSALTTDPVVLSPGSNLTPSLAVETLALSCTTDSATPQIIRGYSWDQ